LVAARSGNISARSISVEARAGLVCSGGAGSGGRGAAREARSSSMLHNVWVRLEGDKDSEWVHAGTGVRLREPPETGCGGARSPYLWSQEQYVSEKKSVLETGKSIFLSARSTCHYRLPSAGVVASAALFVALS
jgi:hypothetical protein